MSVREKHKQKARPPSGPGGPGTVCGGVDDRSRRAATDGCDIVPVGKRRDGGTRYWCLAHKANATAKYGRPAQGCRASHIPPIKAEETLLLDVEQYKGGIAFVGCRSAHLRHNRATARPRDPRSRSQYSP
jgi:hypothetical protein